MMRNTFQLNVLAALALFLGGCNSNIVYKASKEIPGGVWSYQDTLLFDFNIEDTLSVYNLNLEIEHSPEFSYQNLYTRIFTGFPSGDRARQVVSLELADKSGMWQGKCGKNKCLLKIPIQENAYFNQRGAYSMTIEQYMRQDNLPGVYGFTLSIEKQDRQREIKESGK